MGTIDDKEEKVLEEIAQWMDINKECIFATRPWKVFGEGPASDGAPISAQGFNEGKGKPFTAEDVRFTTKGNAIYAIVLGKPSGDVKIKSLGKLSGHVERQIANVEQPGGGAVKWSQNEEALTIVPAVDQPVLVDTAVFKISLR